MLLSAVNQLGRWGRAVGISPIGLECESLLQRARRDTGLDDFGATPWREGFETLVTSCEEDAGLNLLGRFHMRSLLLQSLTTRLRLTERRASPVPRLSHAPLIVCGPPRSGTTFLHRVLVAARPQARGLPFYELVDPLVGAGPDRRLAQARTKIGRLAKLAPSMDAQHLIRPELPDECGHLLKVSFLSAQFWQVPVTRYLEWWQHADATGPYTDYRDLLALMEPNRPLVLKEPFHMRNLEALFEVLPQAMVVQTWRDPAAFVPSFHKLCTTMQRVLTDDLDLERSVEHGTRALIDTAVRAMAVDDPRVLRVSFDALVADPIAVGRQIHAHFGLEHDDEALSGFVESHQRGRFGPNPYRPEDFGQTADGIRGRFREAGIPCP